jgi:hypothetical protein
MRFLQIALFLGLIGFANGGKVKWAEDGKPIIEKSDKPVKGCNKSKLDELVKDSNTTKCK